MSNSNVTPLTAAEVQKVIADTGGNNQAATRCYNFYISIYEQFGRAYIGWALDPNYAVGLQDVVQLREGTTWYNNYGITGLTGTVDTGHVFGSGLNASYWSWNYDGSPGWRQLIVTPNT